MIFAFGYFFHTGDKAHATNHWQMAGKFLSPYGRTTQWYRCRGISLLMLGTEKASLGASSGWSRILKKQSLRSMTTSGQSLGIIETDGSPSWSGPMSSRTLLIFLRWCNSLHVSETFGWWTLESSMDCLLVWCILFAVVLGPGFLMHSTSFAQGATDPPKLDCLVFQVNFSVTSATVTPTKNPPPTSCPIVLKGFFPILWWASAQQRDEWLLFCLLVL